jgi:hypothetical protein
VEKYVRSGLIMRRMRFACWIAKATVTHSEYVIPRPQQLHERASVLRETYIAYRVLSILRKDAVNMEQWWSDTDRAESKYVFLCHCAPASLAPRDLLPR